LIFAYNIIVILFLPGLFAFSCGDVCHHIWNYTDHLYFVLCGAVFKFNNTQLFSNQQQHTSLLTHFHLYPSQEYLGTYLLALLRHFQWTNISVIAQSGTVHSKHLLW